MKIILKPKVVKALRAKLQKILQEIKQDKQAAEDAIMRLEGQTFGGCPDCEQPIDIERLLCVPLALRCASCQKETEIKINREKAAATARNSVRISH